MPTFSTISKLPKELIANLDSLGYTQMTEIQEQTIPLGLAGKDLLAQAKTGSGKTAAFGIPMILGIDSAGHAPQALIMTPTRELADQVAKELRRIARYKENLKIVILCGGTPMRPQIASLEKGADIVVGTPGRLQDHLSRETLALYDIKTLVLDEADRMLDMGFYDAITKIVSNFPRNRQTLLFSATFPENIEKLAKTILKNPTTVKVESAHTSSIIKQVAYKVEQADKKKELIRILKAYKPRLALIFCNMKVETEAVADFLYDEEFLAQSLHGDLDQKERNETLLMFANGSTPILVATDVASRGIDVKDIDLVINYDLPHDPEAYIHRIGRTGRAGSSGMALTLYTSRQSEKIHEIAPEVNLETLETLRADKNFSINSDMITLCIDGGKKSKLRAGDILGTLCKEVGIDAKSIGKIDIFERKSYVAVSKSVANKAFSGLQNGKIKKRNFRVWRM